MLTEKSNYINEKNKAKPSIDTLQNIALIFGVTIDFLVDDKENQTLDTFGFNDKELFVYCQSIDRMSEKTRESLKYILKKL